MNSVKQNVLNQTQIPRFSDGMIDIQSLVHNLTEAGFNEIMAVQGL